MRKCMYVYIYKPVKPQNCTDLVPLDLIREFIRYTKLLAVIPRSRWFSVSYGCAAAATTRDVKKLISPKPRYSNLHGSREIHASPVSLYVYEK